MPVRDTVCGELPALSVKLKLPVRVPRAVGENVTVAVQLAPAPNVLGLSGQVVVTPKSVTLLRMLVIFRVVDWLLVSVTICPGLVVPKACPAKLNLLGFATTG